MDSVLYKTKLGKYYIGDSKDILESCLNETLLGKVQLILTSPPFPLNNKKSYGNLNGENYKKWFISFAEIFSPLLKDDGSIVLELGNAWEPRRPIQSLLNLESLLGFVNNPKANLRLCQEFICYNPSRLPSPTQWVTIERIRVVDSFTRIWWMSKSDHPKADNKKILRPYSKDMKNLLKSKKYNAGKRPSQYEIGQTSFLIDNNGSIMHNLIELEPIKNQDIRLPKNVLSIANTNSNDFFLKTCRERSVQLHPARMPLELATFFIDFLTDPGDIVLDPFAGSNTTGFCAERSGRKWRSIEISEKFAEQAVIRFEDPSIKGDCIVYSR
ncbi:DNA-methyltransferase [Methanothrix soehngenii]|jgi:site-specific DNA-methyltransferase (cytosine-N4-specific)|uniref:Type II methyltransferase n=1 Tax=Candidatus Methanofastidiosum methylothiophilum TaxID=1705564 RepID=A0A150J378_9EURY|nr:MAG: putative methyltransferase [Candidatus Methanofastidiosum methylthiophilus]